MLQFAALKSRDRAEGHAERCEKSYQERVLRPRNECFGSIERKDPRCTVGAFILLSYMWKCIAVRREAYIDRRSTAYILPDEMFLN